MKCFKRVATAFLFFTVTGTVFAGRPLIIDDADPVEQGGCEVELGVGYVDEPGCNTWEIPFGVTAGILPGVEAGLGISTVFEDYTGGGHVEGLSDLTAGVKWQFAGESEWLPRQALAFSVKFPTADDDNGLGSGKTDYDLTWIASKAVGDKSGVHMNVGYAWIGEPSGESVGDMIHYGFALEHQLTDALQWVGELFAEKELQDGTQTSVLCNSGFRWNPSETLTLDFAAGAGLHGDDAPNFFATAGLTWGFDLHK